MSELNSRQQVILNLLVEHYIRFGQPVSSKVIACEEKVGASPATVRNVMMLLEKEGLLHSPHTSAGRIPTPKGYRVFVDQLMSADISKTKESTNITLELDKNLTPSVLCEKASGLLAKLTSLTGVVSVPALNRVAIKKIEFVSLTSTRVLAVLVMADGEVQNRLLDFNQIVKEQQLQQAAEIMNLAISGKDLQHVRDTLIALAKDQNQYLSLLSQLTLDMADSSQPKRQKKMIISGQSHLLDTTITDDFQRLRQLFEEVTEKHTLLQIMEQCYQAPGVKLFIGEEAGIDVMQGCSLVSAPYTVNGEIVGALAVIGPQRMDYSRVIPVVDMTARMLTRAISSKDT